jgi:ketosteroid isomerase-like protein
MDSLTQTNIELAKRATAHLAKRYDEIQRGETELGMLDYQPLFDLMADDVVFKVPCPPDTPTWGGEIRGKQAFVELATVEDPDAIAALHVEEPLTYLGDGDRVVVLTKFSYTLKETGAVARTEIALVLDFRDGLITRAVEIQDMSEWVHACRSGQVRAA